MLRDIEFASEERINISKQIFYENKIRSRNFPIEPVVLSHSTFLERIPSVTSEASNFLLYRLQQNQWINYYKLLKYNPRRKLAWQSFLFPSTPPFADGEKLVANLNQNQKSISELLYTVYGEHSISYERSFEALKWLMQVAPVSVTTTSREK
jgi:hypothetical protein